MLVKGSARGGPAGLARHLEAEENERVAIIGIHGVAARDIAGALIEMDALGAGLKTHRTLYHMSINPEPGKDREMRDSDWQFSERAALKKMGLTGQPYIAVEHQKFGQDGILRRHRHLVASRTDLDHMRAIRADHNYRKHEELARELERHLGHEKVQGAHAERDGTDRPDRTPSYAEMQQAKRGAVGRDQARTLITQLWHTTDTAGALKAALEEQGWMLARGDKTTADGRPYLMVIDPQGGLHELGRRVADVKVAAVHERMAAIDAASLPSVDEARTLQKAARQVEPQRQDNYVEKAQPMSEPPDAPKQPANENERGKSLENEFAKAIFDATAADAKIREAWRQPAWSAATIEADPWTAVYLPVPRDADPQLLVKGIEAAFECNAMIMRGPGNGPSLPQRDYSADDNANHAVERFQELSHRVAAMLTPEGQPVPSPRDAAEQALTALEEYHLGSEPPPASSPADKMREARQISAAWTETQLAEGDNTANQNNPERIPVAAAPEPHQAPEAFSASLSPQAEPTPSEVPHKPEVWQIEDVQGGTVLNADVSAPDGVQSAVAFLDAIVEQKLASMTPVERFSDRLWDLEGAVEATVSRAFKSGRRALDAIGDRFEMFVHFLSDFIAPPPPRTRAQIEIAAKVADECVQERADSDAVLAREAEYDWREMQIARSEQAEDLALGDLHGTSATREATHLARMHVRGRDDDYERD